MRRVRKHVDRQKSKRDKVASLFFVVPTTTAGTRGNKKGRSRGATFLSLAPDICIFRAAGAAEEDGDYGAISVIVLFLVLGLLLTLVVLYKRSVNRKIAKKDGGSFTGARYWRESPFGADLGTVEMNPRGDVEEEEGEAMEMQEMPRGVVDALAQVHADAERGDPDGIEEVDDNASDDENGEFVNPIARLNIESTR